VKVVKSDRPGLNMAERCFYLTVSVLGKGITFQMFWDQRK